MAKTAKTQPFKDLKVGDHFTVFGDKNKVVFQKMSEDKSLRLNHRELVPNTDGKLRVFRVESFAIFSRHARRVSGNGDLDIVRRELGEAMDWSETLSMDLREANNMGARHFGASPAGAIQCLEDARSVLELTTYYISKILSHVETAKKQLDEVIDDRKSKPVANPIITKRDY